MADCASLATWLGAVRKQLFVADAVQQGAVTVKAKLLVGADGNMSAVRQQVLGDGPPQFLGTVIWRAFFPSLPPSWPCPDKAASLHWMGAGKAVSAWGLPQGRLSILAVSPWPREEVDGLADMNYIQVGTAVVLLGMRWGIELGLFVLSGCVAMPHC